MSYVVLARKYRPQSFDDLAGQDHVTRTLANAIASGRVAHAFLFTGVRGVGKTTSARLLAKCLNCLGEDGRATASTSKPCQTCAACREIAAGSDIDVQEIDGASYNGVEEVRRLQEGLAFRPARDRFKVYIVDEVHMLSAAAWNAFLKTLEEPPPHVKFIFATTEVHKVPVTILSRCQRYDFKLMSTKVIAERLRQVLVAEDVTADALAVQTIAREAAGSMRDAMSLLDQVIAFGGNEVRGDDVARVLGVASRQALHDLAAALVAGDAARCVTVVDELAQQGFDLAHVSRDILRHLRDLVIAKLCGDEGRRLLDLADEEVRDVYELASRTDTDDLSRLFQGFSKGFDDVVRSGQPRASLEMTLVRLARRPPLIPLDDLLARLGDLERRLGGGSPPPPRSATPGGGARSGPAQPSRGGSAAGGGWAPSTAHGEPPTRGALALATAPEEHTPPALQPPPPPPLPSNVVPLKPALAAPHAASGLEALRAVLDRVAAVRPALRAVLEHALPVEVNAARLTLLFSDDESHSFLAAQAQEPGAVAVLTEAARGYFGAATAVEVKTGASRQAQGVATLASIDAEARKAAADRAREATLQHPVVAAAIRIFGAEVREVRPAATEE